MRRIVVWCSIAAQVLFGIGALRAIHLAEAHGSSHSTVACEVRAAPNSCDHGRGHADGRPACHDHHNHEAESGPPHDSEDAREAPACRHDEASCEVCVQLALLGTPNLTAAPAAPLVAWLIGAAIVANALIAEPAPLRAVAARPPPVRA